MPAPQNNNQNNRNDKTTQTTETTKQPKRPKRQNNPNGVHGQDAHATHGRDARDTNNTTTTGETPVVRTTDGKLREVIMNNRAKSRVAFSRARRCLVGGVNSPVRAYSAVGGEPIFISRARGAHIFDVDRRKYVDYVGSWGPAIIGHAHPKVIRAISQVSQRGTSFGAPCELETFLAEEIVHAVPSARKVRFVSSGTEAVMTAVRLARGVTNRDKIIKFIGCYHGHSDALLVSAGSGAATLGVPSSPGVPAGATKDTILVPYNDLAAVRKIFSHFEGQVACVLVEPVAGNMGVVKPADGFLRGLRSLCSRAGSLLIFDEVMTGFRLALGGAQEFFGIRPDITTLGKIIGGGMPVGAIAGAGKVMKHLSPEGKIYQAGTLSGNPAAMSAGLATLKEIRRGGKGFYKQLEEKSSCLENLLLEEADRAGLGGKICINRVGSMMTVFFRPPEVNNYDDSAAGNEKAFSVFFHSMLENGIYLPPSRFEAWFVSNAHSREDLTKTARAAGKSFALAAKIL